MKIRPDPSDKFKISPNLARFNCPKNKWKRLPFAVVSIFSLLLQSHQILCDLQPSIIVAFRFLNSSLSILLRLTQLIYYIFSRLRDLRVGNDERGRPQQGLGNQSPEEEARGRRSHENVGEDRQTSATHHAQTQMEG